MRSKAIQDVLIARLIKQQLDPGCLDVGKEQYASGNMVRKEIRIREGIDKETAKMINAKIKDLKLKVQGSIMDDQVRVQGKKIDDLQRSEEHTSELQSLMRISYAVFCLKKKRPTHYS